MRSFAVDLIDDQLSYGQSNTTEGPSMFLFWALLGAAIGAYAAQKKGFSTIGGVMGSLLLGPLAFLLFFVNGIVSANEQQRKCPYCAEWIRPEAMVCKHCHKDVPPLQQPAVSPASGVSPVLKGVLVFAALFFALIIFAVLSDQGGSTSVPDSISRALEPTVTADEFNRLQSGITYSQAVQIIGAPGEEISRSELVGITTVMYAWKNSDGSNMNAMFQNGGMIQKAQFGLR